MHTRTFAASIFVALCFTQVAYAQATIDTLSSWNGGEAIVYWVPVGQGSCYYGQTFRTPDATKTFLTRVETYFGIEQTFPGNPNYVPAPITGQLSLYQWNTDRIMGSALATSSTFSVANNNQWNLISLPLTASLSADKEYIAIFTNQTGGFGRQSFRFNNPFAQGTFFFQTAEQGLSNPWLTLSGGAQGADMAIRIHFSDVPDPGTPVAVGGIIALQGTQNAIQPVEFTFCPTTGSPFTRTMTLNFAGGYNLDGIPSGEYIVSIKGAKWLRKNITVDARAGNVTNANATLLAGDANNDNFADIADLLLLISAYNKVSPNAGYSDAADFNCDGSNDITDLLLLIANYNKQGDSLP